MRYKIKVGGRREDALFSSVTLLCSLALLTGIFANRANHLSGLPQRLLGITVYKDLGDFEGSGEGAAMQWLGSASQTSMANQFTVTFHNIAGSNRKEDYVYDRQTSTLIQGWHYGDHKFVRSVIYSQVSDAKVQAVAAHNSSAEDLLSHGCSKKQGVIEVIGE